ncbi:MAG: hypothetical protein ACLFN5_05015 [bacterium]
MVKKVVFSFVFLFLTLLLAATVLEANRFEDWRRERKQQFDSFREERDRQFHSFLQQRWEQMEVFRGEVEDTAPKVPAQPEAAGAAESDQPAVETGTVEKVRDIKLEAAEEPEVKEVHEEASRQQVEVDYFGHRFAFDVDRQGFDSLKLDSADAGGVADFWEDFAALDPGPLVDRLEEIEKKLDLDGWGYMLLVEGLSERLVDSDNLARLVKWGLLIKSDYRVRVGYDDRDRIFLLYNFPDRLYQLPFFNLDGERYYVYNPPSGGIDSLSTYPQNHDSASRAIDIDLNKNPAATGRKVERQLQFEFQGDSYTIPASYSKEAVAYMKGRPQQALGRYFELTAGSGLGSEMLEKIEQKIEPLEYQEKVNFLLAFVQKSFDYKTDQDHFGREKYMLPAEILDFPYSDCDDRSILFAWLVRRLLKRDVYGLDYPGHAATAVEFESPTGSYFNVDGRAFVISDPTFVNASAGMVMPRFEGVNPGLLP